MWCTRWFLILFLLPYPRASPFFLVLYLFSLVLHSRPCLYCVVLLTALFTSSCYWAPINVPMPSFLTSGSNNVSTRSTDQRCWCDINDGHIFDPFPRAVKIPKSVESVEIVPAGDLAEGASVPTYSVIAPDTVSTGDRLSTLYHLPWPLDTVLGSTQAWLDPLRKTAMETETEQQPPTELSTEAAPATAPVAQQTRDSVRGRSWLRRRYDLREYGIDAILDFGWGRSNDVAVGT